MTPRLFAEHGSDQFNNWMQEQTLAIAEATQEALGKNLVALVLGGGYARGEGGVTHTPEGERPYNDLDFTLVVNHKDSKIAEKLAPVSHRFEKVLGIDVDFSRPLTTQDIKRWPLWLMWSDLLKGHRVITGPPDVLTANAPMALYDSPPLIEATRLLLNRGAGIIWALRIARGLEEAPDPDFIRRNLHKCELAIGDSVIMAAKRHQVLYTGRDAVLRACLEKNQAAARFASVEKYREALEFRLRPGNPTGAQPTEEDLLAQGARWKLALLDLESKRIGREFGSIDVYCAWPGPREPELNKPSHAPKNFLRNLRMKTFSMKYPREGLYRSAPGLLTENRPFWDRDSKQFLDVWRRYN